VADDHRALECSVPKDVIGMGMGIDDVPNRLRRQCADGRKQAAPFAHASAAVNHSDSVAADDKSEVGSIPERLHNAAISRPTSPLV
jgi:hypothetical protein